MINTSGKFSSFLLAGALALAGPAALGQSDEGVDSGWLSTIQDDIAASEYDVSWQQAAWQAPNRAQNLRTYFTQDGIRVLPRTEADPSWELGMFLTRWGRPDRLVSIDDDAVLTADENRIELDRGPIVEWYVNDPEGLEQGFTILERPEDTDTPQPLVLDLAVTGGLRPRISPDGRAVDFLVRSNTLAVRYTKLLVEDASGVELTARIEGFSATDLGGIRLVVDDRDARYPITVDPLMSTQSWTAESNQAGAFFGWKVATAGDVNGDGYSDVIVGAYNYDNGQADEGGAWVYHGSPSGLATTPSWSGEGQQAVAQYGYSAGTAGDVNGDGYADVIVGLRAYDALQVDSGRAYVYHGSATGLSAGVAWSRNGNNASDLFGTSVGTAGDVNGDGYSDVIVGADGRDGGLTNQGAAFAYYGSASGLFPTESWTVLGGQNGARFGNAVGTAGDVNADGYADVIVAAYQHDNGQTNEGAAFVYHGSASGLSTTASWTGEANQASASYGASVGTTGDMNGDGYSDIIVGATIYGNATFADAGRVFFYRGSATGVEPTAYRLIDGEQNLTIFGGSVGTAGDVNGDGFADAIVGAYNYANNGGDKVGRAYVYYGAPSGSAPYNWVESGPQADARFAESVATAGDVNGDGYADIIVGARRYDNGQTDEGRAYVYHGGPEGLSNNRTLEVKMLGGVAGDRLGASVGGAGDVNGDGFDDVIVGAPTFDGGFLNSGRVLVYHGAVTQIVTPPAWTLDGTEWGAQLGYAVDGAGDVNGDGYSDVVIGAPGTDNGGASDAGSIHLAYGSSSGLQGSWSSVCTGAGDQCGFAVATAGDVNGDGYSDLLLGAPFRDGPGGTDEGAAELLLGSATGPVVPSAWVYAGGFNEGRFGTSVSSAGDVNGDGFSDVIVGQPFVSANGGAAYAFYGSAGGLSATPDWNTPCPDSPGGADDFSESVSGAGDVNGDGYSDVIVGGGFTPCPWSYLFEGSPTGLLTSHSWKHTNNQKTAVSGAGDLNGDGYSDVVLGYPYADVVGGGGYDQGMVLVKYGSPIGLTQGPGGDWENMAQSHQADANLGWSVAAAGDVNGDGLADLIAGLPGDTSDQGAFRVYISGGKDGTNRALQTRQLRSVSSDPIDQLGMSDAVDSFRVEMLAYTPYGRGEVALEYEVKPLGTPFDGTGTMTTSYVDSGLTGSMITATTPTLAEESIYRWRARVHYDTPASPFQTHGPWFTIPRNGWEEADLRTGGTPGAGAISTDNPSSAVNVEMTQGGNVRISWGNSCLDTDEDFAVYMGDIGDFANTVPETCSTGGLQYFEYPPDPVDVFYIVVPVDIQTATEGSYGFDGFGVARTPSASACYAQVVESACP